MHKSPCFCKNVKDFAFFEKKEKRFLLIFFKKRRDSVHAIQIVETPASEIRRWALVEVFGHRKHYGEIREVEAFGVKLLEVFDVDTHKTHQYGGAAIFSLTVLSQAEIDAHIAVEAARKARREKQEAELRAWRDGQPQPALPGEDDLSF